MKTGIPALCLIVLFLASCSRHSPVAERPGPAAGSGPVPVLVARAGARTVPVEVRAIGTVQAYSAVAVRSQLTGKIAAVHFHEGQEVRAGDLLFTLDSRPWQAALNQAQANCKRDEAQLASARLEFERIKSLLDSKIASQQDYDSAEAAYQALEATVLADNAAISNAQVNLGYTEIRSPIAGRTGNLTIKDGNVVKAPDDILLSITQVHPIYVAFGVPEQNLPAIRRQAHREALQVTAMAPGNNGEAAQGKLTFIDNTVDTNTGTILLKGTFANTNDLLWPGQFVQVSLTLSNLVDATVVPSQAVQAGQNGEFVFVVKPDDSVEARTVETGIAYDGQVVVVSGLKPGENVVTDGQLRLVPGSKVSIKTPESAGLTSNTTADPP